MYESRIAAFTVKLPLHRYSPLENTCSSSNHSYYRLFRSETRTTIVIHLFYRYLEKDQLQTA